METTRYTQADFKDSRGRYKTLALFEETITEPAIKVGIKPIYTLRRAAQSAKGLPSLYELYLKASDPTGYSFANRYLGGYNHYKKLWQNKFLYTTYFKLWEEELHVKIRSEALQSLYITAISEGPKGIAAAKYIAEYGWNKSDASTLLERAKIEKVKNKGRAIRSRKAEALISDDLERIKKKKEAQVVLDVSPE